MCLLYGTFIDLPVCAQHKSHSISLSKLKPLYGCQHTSIHYVEQRKDILLYASSLRLRKKNCSEKKKSLEENISSCLCTHALQCLMGLFLYLGLTFGPEILYGELEHFCCSICLGFFPFASIYYPLQLFADTVLPIKITLKSSFSNCINSEMQKYEIT